MHFRNLLLSRFLVAATVVDVPLSLESPDNAVQVPADFQGFGFETAFMNNYANNFTRNLLGSVAQRTETTPIIRIGGTSGDQVYFNQNQEEPTVCIAGDCPSGSAATYILGPSYFDGFTEFQDFYMTFQAPLGPDVNLTTTLDYVSQAYAKLGKDRLAAIAIGNEPDLYGGGYTVDQYVNSSRVIMDAVSSNLSFGSQRIYEVLDIARGSDSFNLVNAFEDNLDTAGNVKYAAWHWYQLSNNYTTLAQQQTYLMNHTAVTTHFDELVSQIQYLRANNPEVRFVLSETGSGTSSIIEIQAGFGAALWCVDFQLYSLTQGVSRVDATHRPAALHSYWVPDDSVPTINPGPQVRGVWYALPFVADFIGRNPGKVAALDLGSDTLTAYAIYDASKNTVSKVAVINLQVWVEDGSTGTRGEQTLSIPVPPWTRSFEVRRLKSTAGAQAMGYDYAGPSQNITWAGEQWSYKLDEGKGHLVNGIPTVESYSVTNGNAVVHVSDTEAVLVTFQDWGQ